MMRLTPFAANCDDKAAYMQVPGGMVSMNGDATVTFKTAGRPLIVALASPQSLHGATSTLLLLMCLGDRRAPLVKVCSVITCQH